ncbi:MAG TPA: hypothetical protein VF834_08145 [Streptosporangiaceae bacterium]
MGLSPVGGFAASPAASPAATRPDLTKVLTTWAGLLWLAGVAVTRVGS